MNFVVLRDQKLAPYLTFDQQSCFLLRLENSSWRNPKGFGFLQFLPFSRRLRLSLMLKQQISWVNSLFFQCQKLHFCESPWTNWFCIILLHGCPWTIPKTTTLLHFQALTTSLIFLTHSPSLLFPTDQHLSMKEGSLFVLFCLYRWDPLNWDASDHILDLWKALDEKGCMGLVPGRLDLTCGAKVLEYWMIFSLEIKLN